MPVGSNMPVETIRMGGVNIPIWKNEREFNGKQITTYNYTIQRNYQDAQGNWKNTNSFETKHMIYLQSALRKVFDAIQELKQKDKALVQSQDTL